MARIVLLGLLLGAFAIPAAAANFVVNSSASGAFDVAPGDGVCEQTAGAGDCSLTGAIEESNALAGRDTIALPSGNYPGSSVNLVRDAVVISGAGSATTHIFGDHFDTAIGFDSTDVTLVGITVRGGTGGNVGGGITNYGGHLTLIDCVVKNNFTVNVGGGIYNQGGRLTLIGSTVTSNRAGNVGGGVHNEGTAECINSTITGNLAGNTSGGLGNEGTLTISNCTITGNRAGNTGGGLDTQFDSASVPVVRNSIIAGNLPQDCLGAIASHGYSVLGAGCAAGATDTFATDPQLGPLANNGGGTPTHALLATSPAVNAGNPAVPGSGGDACPATDQRGIDRPSGLRCDSGAFELARCGNGVLDTEEECDDGSNVDGDGCDSNCTVTRCGNGVTTAGEECDDANTADGDCCSSTCGLVEPSAPELAAPSGADLVLKSGAKGKVRFKWKSAGPLALASFGDPTTTSGLSVCLVDTSGAAPRLLADLSVAAGPGWTATSSGFNYRALATGAGKLTRIKLTAGNVGKILAKGWSPKLRPGQLPLVTPARIYVVRHDADAVWSADFETTKRNGVAAVTARSR